MMQCSPDCSKVVGAPAAVDRGAAAVVGVAATAAAVVVEAG